MDLVFMGPPGAGKGTQARSLAQRRGLPHVSTGDLFRDAIREETQTGLEARMYIDEGALVPDDVVCRMVREMLGSSESRKGFILDGFPRTLGQARVLDEDLLDLGRGLRAVVSFEIEDATVVERLAGRQTCNSCGAMYHETNHPTRKSGLCDACGGEVQKRSDDSAETIGKRLEEYKAKTAPLKAYYEERNLLRKVSADGTIDEVQSALERVLGDG